jgi:hypothetical protein
MEPDNSNEYSPTRSDLDGLSPTTSAHVRPRPTNLQTRRDDHSLTSREVLKIFEQAGLMRSQRSIERYCMHDKLDCFFDSDEQRYYVTPASVDRLIGLLKEIQARHQDTADAGRDDIAERDTPRQPPPAPQASAASPDELRMQEEKIKELEQKVFSLSVDKQARDQIVTMLRDQINADRTQFVAELTKQSHRVGQLETEMLQLKAPDRDRLPTPPTPAATYRDVEADVSPLDPNPPISDVPRNEPLANSAYDNYENSTP